MPENKCNAENLGDEKSENVELNILFFYGNGNGEENKYFLTFAVLEVPFQLQNICSILNKFHFKYLTF